MPAADWRELGPSPQRARPPGRLQAQARGCCPRAANDAGRCRPIAHERRRCLAGSWSVRDGRRGRRPRREGCCIGREAHLRLLTHQVPLSRLAHADQLALQEISFSPKPRAPAPKGSRRQHKGGSRPLPHSHQRRHLDLSGCCDMRGKMLLRVVCMISLPLSWPAPAQQPRVPSRSNRNLSCGGRVQLPQNSIAKVPANSRDAVYHLHQHAY